MTSPFGKSSRALRSALELTGHAAPLDQRYGRLHGWGEVMHETAVQRILVFPATEVDRRIDSTLIWSIETCKSRDVVGLVARSPRCTGQ